jgi:hypothetical protein
MERACLKGVPSSIVFPSRARVYFYVFHLPA